jgi:hypothetical protein
MREHQDVGMIVSVLVLKSTSGGVGINVELGGERQVFIWYLFILVAFDVLYSRAKW